MKQRIEAAWKKRQDSIRSLHMEWSDIGRRRLATMPPHFSREIRANFPDAGEFIPVTQELSVRLDGDRFDTRLSTKDGDRLMMPVGLRQAYDGNISQDYSGCNRPGAVGSATVTDRPHEFGTTHFYLKPLLVAFRPLHPTIGRIDMRRHKVAAEAVPLGTDFCVVLEEVESDDGARRRYWLDPNNDFIMLRYQAMVDGREKSRIDVSYSKHPEFGWLPSEWKSLGFDDESVLTSSFDSTVVKTAINVPIPLREFQIAFPPGTHVTDLRPGKQLDSSGPSSKSPSKSRSTTVK